MSSCHQLCLVSPNSFNMFSYHGCDCIISLLGIIIGRAMHETVIKTVVRDCNHGLSRYLFSQYTNRTPAISSYCLLMANTWFSRPTKPVDWRVTLVNFSSSWILISTLTVMLSSTRKPLPRAKASARGMNWVKPQSTLFGVKWCSVSAKPVQVIGYCFMP